MPLQLKQWITDTDRPEFRNQYDLYKGMITNKLESNRIFNKLFWDIWFTLFKKNRILSLLLINIIYENLYSQMD